MIAVRRATKGDAPAIGDLMAELLRHYQLPAAGPDEMAAIIESRVATGCSLLAFDGSNLVGFAFYALLFPGEGLSPQLYVKDIYTRSSERRRGIARSLFQALAKEARARGCTRIDWTTERDNRQAQAVYRALGASLIEDKLYYRLDQQGIERLCELPA